MLKLAGVAFVAVLGLVFALLWVGFDATGLGNQALAQLTAGQGLEGQLSGARFSLRDGLALEGVRTTAFAESGSLRTEAAALRLAVDWLPLLRGTVRIRSLEIVDADLDLTLSPDAWSGEGGEMPTAPLPLHIEQARLHDARLVVRLEEGGAPILEVEGLELELDGVSIDPTVAPPLLGMRGEGRLAIGPTRAGGLRIDRADGAARLADGVFEIDAVSASAAAGTLHVPRVRVDLTGPISAFDAALAADPVDLDLLAGFGPDSGLGAASIEASLAGMSDGRLDGDGVLRLGAGGLPGSPSLAALDELLGTSLSGFRYQDSEIRWIATPGGVDVLPFELVGDGVKLRGEGQLRAGEELDFRLGVAVSRRSLGGGTFASPVLDGLTDEEGWATFPVRLAGTLLEPTWSVDMEAVRASGASALKRSLEDELEKRVGRALGHICCGHE